MTTCPNCGNKPGEGAIFCDQCGARLPKVEAAAVPVPAAPAAGGNVICPACGAGNVPGEAFCEFCGGPLAAPLPAPAAAGEGEGMAAPEPPAEPAGRTPFAPTPAPEPAPAAAPGLVCPACGAAVLAGEAFCADCGASLAKAPLPPEPVPEAAPEPVAEAAPSPPPVPAPEPVAEAAPPLPPVPAPEPVAEAAPPPPPVPAPEPVPEPSPLPAPEPAAPPAPPAKSVCIICGAELEPGDKYCSDCGALQPAAQAAPAAQVAPAPAPELEPAPAPPGPRARGPRLVVSASGAEIPLPAKDEILIGREDPVSGIFPDVDLTPHGGDEGGVSRRHARILSEGGTYYLVDQNSTNLTYLNKQRLAPETRQPLKDGDEIRCGRVALLFVLGG